MDGTSPGNMPVSLGEVWIGQTHGCAPNPIFLTEHNSWPPRQTFVPVAQTTYAGPQPAHLQVTAPQRLSDEDVERIAKRVAELLREPR